MRERPWLDALTELEERSTTEKERRATAIASAVGETLEPLVHRGAKSPSPSPHGGGTSVVNTTDAEPIEARRTLVTSQDQLAEVIADVKDVDLVTLDLETTGLDPRRDSIRLPSLATRDG